MASNVAGQRPPAERQWFIVGRWQEFEGEGRANLLRVVGLVCFYAVELVNYYGLHLGFLQMPAVVTRPFHLAVTFLTLAWAMVCLAVLLCRQAHYFPSGLKFLSTGADLVLLTSVLTLGDGPRSPLVAGYFLVVVAAALRFSLPLVWFATAGAVAGYLFLLAYARWFAGRELDVWLDQAARDLTVPRYHQVIVVMALVLTGVIVGQVIRRVRSLAEAYAVRVAPPGEGQP
jgi:hypothetical protein